MRVGIFTECYKPTINGVVMSIEAFRTQLENKGHHVFIFAPNYKKAEFQPNVFRVPSITLPSPKDYPIGFPYFSHLGPTISKLALDIVHTQHIFLMGGFGQYIARKLQIPTVHTYHTMMTEYTHYVPLKPLQNVAKKFIISRSRNFCNRANRVIVPSSPMIDVLKSYGVKNKIEVLPTGIDLNQFRKLSSNERRTILERYEIPPNEKILLSVGRIAKEKNLDLLLLSLKDILKEIPDARLIFVGSGPYESTLKQHVKKLNLEKSVSFTGFLTKPEANQFFGLADIFVFSSTTDTQGIVLAEAMASSTPVVAIDKLGPKDIIDNGKDGFLVPLNRNEFSDKILRLLKDERLRKNFSLQAKIDAEKFSIEKCTQKLIKIYEETKDDFTHYRSPKYKVAPEI